MKHYVKITFMVLLAAGVLFFGGCKSDDGENTVDSGLVGKWSNGLSGDNEKTFSIKSDGSFTAALTPYPGQQGKVDGILIKDSNGYKMNKMKESTGTTSWGAGVALFNGTVVQIMLSENNTVFTLSCKDSSIVGEFFGGKYYRQP
jgi:hypothetical protein